MGNTEKRIDQIFIKVNGADLSPALMRLLYYAEVEASLYLPSMATLRFDDDDFELIDNPAISLGNKLEISVASTRDPQAKIVFQGEITALEPEFNENSTSLFVVRGYDVRHRLNARNTRTFVNKTDLDIVKQIVKEAGIAPGKMDATSPAREHIFQDNQTDMAFIQMLALRNGFEIVVKEDKLNFCKPAPTSAPLELKWRENLRRFRPRVTLSEQVKEVEVRAWDRKKKQSIVERDLVKAHLPKVGMVNDVTKAPNFAKLKYTEGRVPMIVQGEAGKLAKSLAQEIGAGYAEAEGTALGNGSLMPGSAVNITNVGTRFGGTYTLTSTRHTFSPGEGYDTDFTIEGIRPQQVSDLVGGSSSHGARWQGVIVGIVTDNNDPDKLNRIKVKFPTLTEEFTSTWAPVIAAGAGNNRGIHWMPEVNDEVLVAFEFGDINSPFVLGSLWNGKDAPAQPNAAVNGSVVIRTMKTRVGHVFRMIDADQSGMKKGIELIDSTGGYKIVIDATTGEIIISSNGKVTINATGDVAMSGMNVSIKATKALNLEAMGDATLKGLMVNINP